MRQGARNKEGPAFVRGFLRSLQSSIGWRLIVAGENCQVWRARWRHAPWALGTCFVEEAQRRNKEIRSRCHLGRRWQGGGSRWRYAGGMVPGAVGVEARPRITTSAYLGQVGAACGGCLENEQR